MSRRKRNRGPRPRIASVTVCAVEQTAPPDVDLRICQTDTLFRALEQHFGRPSPWLLLVPYLFFFIGMKLVLAYLSGVLTIPQLAHVASIDALRYPFSARIAAHFANGSPAYPNPAVIPYLRDYSDLLLMAFMAIQMIVFHRLWHAISTAPGVLYREHVINRRGIAHEEYAGTIQKYRAYFDMRRWKLVSATLAVALPAGAFYTVYRYGIYRVLSGTPDDGWSRAAYANWWANPASHPVLFAYQFAVLAFLCYYTMRNNIIGLTSLFLCQRLLPFDKAGVEPALRLKPTLTDDAAGLGPLRQVVGLTYYCVVSSVICLSIIYCCFGNRHWLIPFYAIFVVLNPVYVLGPLFLIRRHIKWSKQHQIAECENEIRELLDSYSPDAVARLQRKELELMRLRDVPNFLFSAQHMWVSFVIYYIPVILFIDWVVKFRST